MGLRVMLAGLMATAVSVASPSRDGGGPASPSDARAAAFDLYLAWVRGHDDSHTAFLRAMKGLVELGQTEWVRKHLVARLESCSEREKASPDNFCWDQQTLLDSLPQRSSAPADAAATNEPSLDGREAQRAIDAAVEERLARPALWGSYRVVDVKPGKRARGKPVRFPLPEGDAVFAALEGRRAVVVATSTDVDPRGEDSVGGYVVYLSGDRGKTWRGPFHTGLAEGFPFRLRDNGGARAFDGEVLQLPVDVGRIELTTMTVPPVPPGTLRERRDCVLRIPLDALEKDTDGDGLPDLLEERLATDPQSADTDGDGIPDAWDTYPLQPGSTVSADGRFIAAALHRRGSFEMPIVHDPAGDLKIIPQRPDETPTAWAWRRTLFFVDAPILPEQARVVRLSRKALGAYFRKLGPIYPFRVRTLVSDGHRAVVDLTASWCGFTSLVEEREDGSFSVSLIKSWIT